MNHEFTETLERSPVIAAVFESSDLDEAIESPCEVIFLLSGSICELHDLIDKVHEKGKKLYIHIDLLEGVANDRSGIQFIKNNFSPDGIITTKATVARHAKEQGMFVIQRFFVLDSKSFENAYKTIKSSDVDAIEILPGILPEIISQISQSAKMPVIAGGLIRSKKNAVDSLAMGAMAVSTSCKKIWNM
ncbi:glycerol-3-phosphate responsive antiterminator [Clostridium minihomine]|uniref:glycerol-3-phosphate responsive antiterminator n=1 Tax=Clostridium minihomine TaxID=2045012 RepID=UPI000C760868|nr:glycerol-3-phosphate responsive antiterminator [Clostridium minihomine]